MTRKPAETPPEGSLTRVELMDELARRGLHATANNLRYWQSQRWIPAPRKYTFSDPSRYTPEHVEAVAEFIVNRIPIQSIVCPHCGKTIRGHARPYVRGN